MDGSNIDHSDSDSIDSWTILDHCPSYGEEAPEIDVINENLQKETTNLSLEKDEDTDGISIISDSDPESPSSCEMVQDINVAEQSCPTEITPSQFLSYHQIPSNNDHDASITNEADFLGDNTCKHKTYVHRRNKRLSTVLNIIMLGSVITAAGVAIGHMWGARNECATHTTPSINKILSNLYKLQEENTYLRNKLKELTVINSLQMQHKKLNNAEKLSFKQLRCKKMYEGPLDNKNTEKMTKCLDTEINNVADIRNHLVQPQYEKEFEKDILKLKHIYQQNRSWLDEEIAKRLKHEEDILRKNVKSTLSSITEEQKVFQDDIVKIQIDVQSDQNKLNSNPDTEVIQSESYFENNSTDQSVLKSQKISYADSLKSDQQLHKVEKRETNLVKNKDHTDNIVKIQEKNKDVTTNYVNFSEEDLKKDDRYIRHKHRKEMKKRDRQKLHKKQKRRNKYEQWEMKGGYMKDYDEFSMTSAPDSENILKRPNGNQLGDALKITYTNQLPEIDTIKNINLNTKLKKTLPTKNLQKSKKLNSKGEDTNWYNTRAILRTEARKQLERELFGDTSPSNAGWYFRRMQKREQCRAKSDNSTYKKFYKRNMNFKTKN